MRNQEWVALAGSLALIPASVVVASLALRDNFSTALIVYAITLAASFATAPRFAPWTPSHTWQQAFRFSTRRVFFLVVLAALSFHGSCPHWFLGLMLSASLMQWAGFVLVRPHRLGAAVLPEVQNWNTAAQSLLPAVFLADFFLIQVFPRNFQFSANFHLAGYAFLASLQVMQLTHDFYRIRRPILFWLRALAFQPH
jgi:hypothetical protein